MAKKAPRPKPKHMANVAHLLGDMAKSIEVCDTTLKYMDKAVQKQQQGQQRSLGEARASRVIAVALVLAILIVCAGYAFLVPF